MPRNRSELAPPEPPTTTATSFVYTPFEPDRPDRFEVMKDADEPVVPKEPTNFDYFKRGFKESAMDGGLIVFVAFHVVIWVWAIVALGWFLICFFAGFSTAGVAAPHFYVPVGYSTLWAIGGLIALVIERGRETW